MILTSALRSVPKALEEETSELHEACNSASKAADNAANALPPTPQQPSRLRCRQACVPCRRRLCTLLKASPIEKGAGDSSRRQRVGCIISRFRCRVARLVQFGRFFLKRLGAPPKSTRQYHTDRTAWVSAHVIFRSQPGWSHMSAESAKEEGWSSWPHGQSHLTHHCRMECCNRATA